MHFKRLCINNIGNFFGRFEFNLEPNSERNLVLFGGLNGAGKTTLFDAIKLCLYGPEMFGAISIAKYHIYLKHKIHKSKATLLSPDHASIELNFEYASFGGTNDFHIERAWETRGSKVVERLTVKKNGLSLDDVEKGSWQEFIKEMIPLGLSQLFFFDGEKIRKMMVDENSDELRNSILSLLGLDVVERLQADLKIYRSKSLKEVSSNALSNELTELDEKKLGIENEVLKIESGRACLENSVKRLESQIAKYKSKMSAQGESYYKNRANHEERKKVLERAIEQRKEMLRDLAADCLPIAIASSCASKLKVQIEVEKESKINALVGDSLAKKREDLLSAINSDEMFVSAKLNKVTAEKVRTALTQEMSRIFPPAGEVDNIEELFGFSDKQELEILRVLDKAQHDLPEKLSKLTKAYEKHYSELHEVTKQLNRVPDEEFIRPMYETLQELNAKESTLAHQQQESDTRIDTLRNEIAEIDRKIDVVTRKIQASVHLTGKLSNVNKVENVLTKYYAELTRQKIEQLQIEFSEIFNMLHRKEDMISRVAIDPTTCDVTLFDANHAKINRSNLSSGELEIYAISLLWALAKTSGQRLPFIVDTPLARLDSVHRDNLIKHFFPVASNQVMIFSTNTEVDQKYFEKLKPNLAQAFNLDYDEKTKTTVVKEGYFWN